MFINKKVKPHVYKCITKLNLALSFQELKQEWSFRVYMSPAIYKLTEKDLFNVLNFLQYTYDIPFHANVKSKQIVRKTTKKT